MLGVIGIIHDIFERIYVYMKSGMYYVLHGTRDNSGKHSSDI